MKKLYVLFLTVCLLFGSMVLPISAVAEATDELASNYISPEMEEKLREKISYSKAIRVYNLGHYFYDLAEGASVREVILKYNSPAEYVVFNEEGDLKHEVERFVMWDEELSLNIPSKVETQLKQQFYKWLKEVSTASFLEIKGEGRREIVNIYCLMSYMQNIIPIIAYDVGDAMYYSVYDQGMEETAIFFTEKDFFAYVQEWVTIRNNELGEEYLGGAVTMDADRFNPLNVKLRKTAVPIWVLPAGIVLGGGIATVVIVRRRKRKAVSEGELSA